MSAAPPPGRCPVCQASFRGAANCSRCGADLVPMMLLVAHAWGLRQQARDALRRGDARTALGLAEAAQQLHTTPQGHVLHLAGAAINRTS